MKDDFELGFWTWFATDEHRLVRDACHGMKALDFLHLPSSAQSMQVNCCPECDIEDLMTEVEDFRRSVESSFPTLESQLVEVLNECHQLPASALKWNEVEMFTDPAWEPARKAASKALQIAGWHNLRSHVEEQLRKSGRLAADKGVADTK